MIVRRRHNGRFAALPNAIWTDTSLSVEAKGVLGYLLSRPHNWHVRLGQVGRALKVGKDKLQRIFRELIDAGYVTREQQQRTDDGSFGGVEYVVRDEAEGNVATLPQPENPEPAQPSTAQPSAANKAGHISKTDSNKTDLTKTDPIKPLTPNTPCPSPTAPPAPLRQKKPGSEEARKSEHPSVVQARVASRLGNGDTAKGWILLGALSDSERDMLTAAERGGRLTESALVQVRFNLREVAR